MNCPAIEILTEVRDLLRDLNTLDERRRKHRELVARRRAETKSVTSQVSVMSHKEEEKGKETFSPLTPLIEKSEKEKKTTTTTTARARGFLSCSQLPTVEEVAAFAKEIGSDIDPAYFWRYYNSNHRRWPSEWRDRLRNWTVNGIPRGRIQPKAVVKPPQPPHRLDWTLCAERCAHCTGNACARGITVPPPCQALPRPPEECPHFKGTGGL